MIWAYVSIWLAVARATSDGDFTEGRFEWSWCDIGAAQEGMNQRDYMRVGNRVGRWSDEATPEQATTLGDDP